MTTVPNRGCVNSDNIYFATKLISIFSISGSPAYWKTEILKWWLICTGMIGIWQDGEGYHYGVAQYADKPLEDGTSDVVLISNRTKVVEKKRDECGLIWLNSLRYPLLPLVNRYATLMIESDISLRALMLNSRSCKMPVASTDADKKQWDEVFKAQKAGARHVPVIPSVLVEDVKLADLGENNSGSSLTELMDVRQRLMAEYDNQLGIGVFDGMKRERMISSEMNNIQNASRINVQDMFDNIEKGLRDCDKLGLDMHIEWGECYNVAPLPGKGGGDADENA